MMPALPFVQVIVSLSSDFNALSLTVTVALVAALLAAKALLKNFSSYSPAGKGVDVVWSISVFALPQPKRW